MVTPTVTSDGLRAPGRPHREFVLRPRCAPRDTTSQYTADVAVAVLLRVLSSHGVVRFLAGLSQVDRVRHCSMRDAALKCTPSIARLDAKPPFLFERLGGFHHDVDA